MRLSRYGKSAWARSECIIYLTLYLSVLPRDPLGSTVASRSSPVILLSFIPGWSGVFGVLIVNKLRHCLASGCSATWINIETLQFALLMHLFLPWLWHLGSVDIRQMLGRSMSGQYPTITGSRKSGTIQGKRSLRKREQTKSFIWKITSRLNSLLLGSHRFPRVSNPQATEPQVLFEMRCDSVTTVT